MVTPWNGIHKKIDNNGFSGRIAVLSRRKHHFTAFLSTRPNPAPFQVISMKLSITKKLILVFALGLLCLAGIGYLLYHNNHSTSAKPLPPTIDQAFPKALNSLRASLKDLEAAELGYALSGEEQYKTAIRTAATQVHRFMDDMKSQSEDAPARHQNIVQIDPLITQRVLFSEQVIEARDKKGRKRPHAQIQTGFGKEIAAQIETGLCRPGAGQDAAASGPGCGAGTERALQFASGCSGLRHRDRHGHCCDHAHRQGHAAARDQDRQGPAGAARYL